MSLTDAFMTNHPVKRAQAEKIIGASPALVFVVAVKPVHGLIPFVAAYVDKVDLEARRIDVDWGLDY